MSCFYDFLSLTGLFPKVVLIHNRLFKTIRADFSPFKSAKAYKKSGLNFPKGTGFYTLRMTAATFAARSGDPFAVQRLLGHADLKMASVYVQDVSAQTDRVIENSRKYII